MIRGQNVICFCNDWDGDPLSKKQIMRRVARENRVLWVNSLGNRNPTLSSRDLRRVCQKLWQFSRGVRQVDHNIFVLSPLAIPFHGLEAARRFNSNWLTRHVRRTAAELGFDNPIIWTFLPTSADTACALPHQLLIYQCVDEYSEFTGTDKAAILGLEQRLLQAAHLVVVSSESLLRDKQRLNRSTYLVPHGVDVQHFRAACDPATAAPRDLDALPRPRIGFHGLIADWVDLQLIRFLALSKPHWSFALIGKVDTDPAPVLDLPNVHLLGRKDYATLPAYCRGLDVAVLPFVVNALTVAANPLKLREYLAAGLPVVATPLPEAEKLRGHLRIGRSFAHFLGQLEDLVAEGRTGPQMAISQSMEGESWENRVDQISQLISAVRRPPPAAVNVAHALAS